MAQPALWHNLPVGAKRIERPIHSQLTLTELPDDDSSSYSEGEEDGESWEGPLAAEEKEAARAAHDSTLSLSAAAGQAELRGRADGPNVFWSYCNQRRT